MHYEKLKSAVVLSAKTRQAFAVALNRSVSRKAEQVKDHASEVCSQSKDFMLYTLSWTCNDKSGKRLSDVAALMLVN